MTDTTPEDLIAQVRTVLFSLDCAMAEVFPALRAALCPPADTLRTALPALTALLPQQESPPVLDALLDDLRSLFGACAMLESHTGHDALDAVEAACAADEDDHE